MCIQWGTRLFVVILLVITIIPNIFSNANRAAHADGIHFETVPGQLIGGNPTALFVKISPTILTNETSQDSTIELRLFNTYSNETIEGVSYHVKVNRNDEENRDLMRTNFYSYNGSLTLKILPKDVQPRVILGEYDPVYNSWSNPNDELVVETPMLLNGGGLFHMEIRILGFESNKLVFDFESAPRFDAWLSVGEIFHNSILYGGESHDIAVVSYYDKINDFTFDQSTNSIRWSMPFNWNLVRIHQQNIFVHEEFIIPKALISAFGSQSFYAEVNGIPLTHAAIAVDPYTSETNMIVHYLINKATIIELARISDTARFQKDTMSFTLTINTLQGTEQQTTTELITETGRISIDVAWQPKTLSPNIATTLEMRFFEFSESTGEKMPLNSDVYYDLIIIDKNGNEVLRGANLVAKEGTAVQFMTFPSEEIYQIKIEIKGIMQDNNSLDNSRNGKAIGIVIVPEFSLPSSGQYGVANIVLAMGSSLAILPILIKKVRMNLKA